jgi:hypothetical protein
MLHCGRQQLEGGRRGTRGVLLLVMTTRIMPGGHPGRVMWHRGQKMGQQQPEEVGAVVVQAAKLAMLLLLTKLGWQPWICR